MDLLERANFYNEFLDILNNPDVYIIARWYENPPSTGKQEAFDKEVAKKFLERIKKNTKSLLSKIIKTIESN